MSLCYTQVTCNYALIPSWYVSCRVPSVVDGHNLELQTSATPVPGKGVGTAKGGASLPDLVSWGQRARHPPALGLQFAADGGQGEEGWGAVCGDKLLPEQLHVEAIVQCAGQAVGICVHLPDDLQARRWLVRQGPRRMRPTVGERGAGRCTGSTGRRGR